jgi:hypothetical protein
MSHEKNPFINLSDKRFESSSLSQKYQDLLSLFFGNDIFSSPPLPDCEKIQFVLGEAPSSQEKDILYFVKVSKNSADLICYYNKKVIKQFQLRNEAWFNYLHGAAIEKEDINFKYFNSLKFENLQIIEGKDNIKPPYQHDVLYIVKEKQEVNQIEKQESEPQLTFYFLSKEKNELQELDKQAIPPTLIESYKQIIRMYSEGKGSFTINFEQSKYFYGIKTLIYSGGKKNSQVREYPWLMTGDKFHFGLFDYIGAFFLRWLSEKASTIQEEIRAAEQEEDYKPQSYLPEYALQFVIGLFFWPIFFFYFAAAFTLFLLSLPFVPIVHFFFQREQTERTTPVRKSLCLNPSTWILGAILLEGMSLLIQGFNPAGFLQAAGPFLVMQIGCVAMASLAVLFSIAYSVYRMSYTLYSVCSDSKAAQDFYSSEPEKQFDNRNVITHYLKERLEWMEENLFKSSFIIGFGGILFIIAVALIIDYFTGGMLPNTLMGHILDFMSKALLAGIHGIINFSGIEFLNGFSEITLSLVAHILSAVTLLSGIFFITDNILRVCTYVTEAKDVVDSNADQPIAQAEVFSLIANEKNVKHGEVLLSVDPIEENIAENSEKIAKSSVGMHSSYYRNL